MVFCVRQIRSFPSKVNVMKLCVSTYSLIRWRRESGKSVEDCLRFIKDQGADVEFSNLGEDQYPNPLARAEHLRNECEKLGVKITGYNVGGELCRPANTQREEIEKQKKQIDVAAVLGVRSTRQDVTRGYGDWSQGLTGPQTFAACLKTIVPALRELADYAKSKNVILTLENHGFYMQASRRVEQLIDRVNHPNYALTMDMGNFLCVNENPVKAVERLVKKAVMVHAKDFFIRPKDRMPASGWFATPTKIALRGAIAGHGEIDIPAELKLVKEAGYDGYLSLEFEGMEEPTRGVQLGLEYLRSELTKLNALTA